MIRVIILGAAGRVGKENIKAFSWAKDFEIVGAVEAPQSKSLGLDAGRVAGIEAIGIEITSNGGEAIQKCDVCIDFTTPEATLEMLKIANTYKKGAVIGTTGFTVEQIKIIKTHAETIPVLLSPNMSQGVNILSHLAGKAAELLGYEYDVEITEIHHNLKKDAPSGTALQLGEVIAQTRGTTLGQIGIFSRHGIVGERKKGEIGISSIRLSDVVGEHTVMFGGPGERIELIHKSSSRMNYAYGALRAARFISGRQHGFFSMKDVLGIS
jgi:4-hydroxy-tetrahydrodipicolinate reductase